MNDEQSCETVELLPRLPARRSESHKGDYGRVLVVAGSRGMAGAASLTGVAALRGGAGWVRVAVPQSVWNSVASYEPSYLTWPLPEDAEGRIAPAALPELQELIAACDVLAMGPGLGRSPDTTQIVAALLAAWQKPTVLDADAIYALAQDVPSRSSLGPHVVLTPHPGEFARLIGQEAASVQRQRRKLTLRFAEQSGAILVLKGHQTLVSDGRRLFINPTGNPGMATGGSGDVLTGLIAALAAQGLAPFDAAVLAVYVHGLAGDLAARDFGPIALIASDLLRYLPAALRSVQPA